MKKAFVTGGAGHVGGNLVRQLLDDGWQIRCLIHRDTRALNGLNVEQVQGSLTDSKALAKHMDGCNVVFHAAAHVAIENINISVMERVNVGGTEAMCNAALEAQIPRFIHFSSIHAFQQHPTSKPLDENRHLVNDSKAAPYDRTKALAQKKVLDACHRGLNASILHPTGIIGPYDFKPSRMGQVIFDIVNRKMPISINNGFNWVDVRDVCQTAINCIDKGKKGQHYIVPGAWASFRNIADIISDFLGFRTTFFTAPFWTAYTALPFTRLISKLSGDRPSFSRGSLHALAVQCKDIPGTLARKELGHTSRSLKDTIIDTLNEMRNGDPHAN